MQAIIDFSEEDLKRLSDVCARDNVYTSEFIQRALQFYLDSSHTKIPMDAVRGLWKDRHVDPVEYQRHLRTEWD